MSDVILCMEGLSIEARSEHDSQAKTIVDSVDLTLRRGEVLGLIGESGAGKSTIGLAALGYTRAGCAIVGGKILFDGKNIRALPFDQRRRIRGQRIAYISQSAAASFNPAKRILQQICEGPVRHGLMGHDQARSEAIQLFRELDLPSPETFGERYPHQVSGGQLQRAMAAMAMSCKPDVLVLDEPTTALDVTTQIEVLAAIRKLIREYHAAGLYITHDLAVVAQVANRILVLRHGKKVEEGETEQILQSPRMDYTRALVSNSRSQRRSSRRQGAGGGSGTGASQRHCQLCQSGSRCRGNQLGRAQGRNRRGGGRIGQRQEYARPGYRRAAAAREGRHLFRGASLRRHSSLAIGNCCAASR